MSQGKDLRARILLEFDHLLKPEGYRRRKSAHAWWRTESDERRTYFHLGFGRLGSPLGVTPSLGARHAAVERLLRAVGVRTPDSRDSVTFWATLATLAGGEYYASSRDGGQSVVNQIWADWCAEGRKFLEETNDLAAMARRLEANAPQIWPCPSRSHRARLLPVVLVAAKRQSEALAWLPKLRIELTGSDQVTPSFAEFERVFRAACDSGVWDGAA